MRAKVSPRGEGEARGRVKSSRKLPPPILSARCVKAGSIPTEELKSTLTPPPSKSAAVQKADVAQVALDSGTLSPNAANGADEECLAPANHAMTPTLCARERFSNGVGHRLGVTQWLNADSNPSNGTDHLKAVTHAPPVGSTSSPESANAIASPTIALPTPPLSPGSANTVASPIYRLPTSPLPPEPTTLAMSPTSLMSVPPFSSESLKAQASPIPELPTPPLSPEPTTIYSLPKLAVSVPPFSEFDHCTCDAHTDNVELAPHHTDAINEIREQWRRRQAWHQQEKSLTLSAKAMCRRLVAKGEEKAELKDADALYAAMLGKGAHPLSEVAFGATFPIIEARDCIERHRKAVEKRLAKLAASLPIAEFIKTDQMRGVGIGSLAAVIGEAGDLGAYANPAKLWKRMGLAVMPDGRQRRIAGAAALLHGYSPRRRSVMWNIGDCIVKAGGPLRQLYDERKAVEHAKATAEGLTVAPAAKIPKASADLFRSEGHVHNRAKRYVEKRVLLLLWRAWRVQGAAVSRNSEPVRVEVEEALVA